MDNDINKLFQDYLAQHADDQHIDFAPLLEKYPHLRESLQNKVCAYQKVVGALHVDNDNSPAPELAGKTIGDCCLGTILGQGGMGVVYLARQEKLKRDVVVKILRPFASNTDSLKERFKRESRIIGRLNHNNIVPVYDVGEDNGSLYIIMRYVKGTPLNVVIERFSKTDRSSAALKEILGIEIKAPIEFFCNLVIKVADAIQYAHDNGVIHRDIKPSNIIVEPDGNPVLLDFGLSHDDIEKNLTISGEFLGTPIYSAPESFQKQTTKDSSLLDVYSLGATLYELLTCSLPYEGDTIYEIYSNIKNKEPIRPKLRWSQIPRDLEIIISTAIIKDPQLRYPNIETLRNDLQNFLSHLPIWAKTPSLVKRVLYFTKRRKSILAFIILFIVIAALIGSFITYRNTRHNRLVYALSLMESSLVDYVSGRTDQAINKMEKAIALAPEVEKKWKLKLIEFKLNKSSDYSNALDEIKALDFDKSDVDSLYSVMSILSNQNKYADAAKLGIEILSIEPKYEVYRMLPAILYNLNRADEAMKYINEGLRHWPDDGDLNWYKGFLCEQMKDYECADRFYLQAAKLNMEHLDDYGFFLFKTKRYNDAAIYLKKATDYSPKNELAFRMLSEAYFKTGQCKNAIDSINMAKRLEPLKPTTMKQYKKIASNCNVGILQEGSHYDLLKGKKRGYDLLNQGKYDEAVDILKNLLILHDKDPDLYHGIGFGLAKMGQYGSALIYLEKYNEIKQDKKTQKLIDSIKAHLSAYEDQDH